MDTSSELNAAVKLIEDPGKIMLWSSAEEANLPQWDWFLNKSAKGLQCKSVEEYWALAQSWVYIFPSQK